MQVYTLIEADCNPPEVDAWLSLILINRFVPTDRTSRPYIHAHTVLR